jgi:hypothetical protein
VKFGTMNGQPTATLIGTASKNKADLVSFKLTGDRIRIVVKGGTDQVFDGLLAKDGKKIAGVLVNDKTGSAAYMVPTDMTTIAAKATSTKLALNLAEMRAWADAAARVAKDNGQAWPAEINAQLGMAFLTAKHYGLAVQHADAAEKALNDHSSPEQQVKVLQSVSRILMEGGNIAELRPVAARLDKLEKIFDDEYHATVPSFKAQKFFGRSTSSDRVVVMELFTGAQCPDCPPADVAFDVLQQSYKPSELVLMEYHLHIPGADPLTNADTEARWKYYRNAHGAKAVPGVPTSLFNGTPKGGNGGRLPDGEKYYQTYRGIVDPLLDTPAQCKITASAKQVGNKILINAQVTGLNEPGKDKKIRLALVEKSIRFLGSNRIRFHHQVVRAFPGGTAGVAIMKADTSVKAEVDLLELRKQLVGYLDTYAATTRPFPQVARPLDLQQLCVIAFVQDDVTHEILQAVQVELVH